MTTASSIIPDDTGERSRPAAMVHYFWPLALQAASQGLTYPMAAMVASRGSGGPLDMAGLIQATTVMFLLGTLGFGLVTTGMVFGRSAEGFRVYHAVCRWIAIATIGIQGLLCLPPVARLLFENLIGVPASIGEPARLALTACIPLQFVFFMRIPYQVAMYNARATTRASLPTLLRIVLTAMLVPVFATAGWGGPAWGVACLGVPVVIEVLMSRYMAGPYLERLQRVRDAAPPWRELVAFNLPLSIGGMLLSLSATMLAAFIARADFPEVTMPVYYLALGVVTPLAYSATRAQEVVLAFGGEPDGPRRTFRFALGAGAVIGLLPLVLIVPGIAERYYIVLQNLPAAHLPLIRHTALALVLYPLCVAIRAQGEGLAGRARRPLCVIVGQAVFMGAVIAAAAILLALRTPGYLIGPAGLIGGNLASTVTLRRLLRRAPGPEMPVPPTTTSHGQIR